MNGKFIGVVIGAVVAIMLVGGVLMPVINEQTTPSTGTENNPDAFGPSVDYIGGLEPATENMTYFSIKYSSSSQTFNMYQMDTNGLNYLLQNATRDAIPNKAILYADNNATIYIDDMTLTFDYVDSANTDGSYDLSTGLTFVVKYNSGTYQYGANTGGYAYVTPSNPIAYYYIAFMEGDYSNCTGDNPPTMDTPTVSVNGMYIGLKAIEKEIKNPTAPLYLAIPIVILVALLTAVAFVAFRKDY